MDPSICKSFFSGDLTSSFTSSLSSLKSALLQSRAEVLLALFLLLKTRDFKLSHLMAAVAKTDTNLHPAHDRLC